MTPSHYRSLRRKLGLTQAGLAALLGLTRETITRRETGTAPITEEAAMALRQLITKSKATE
jgi:transcriptional regulator with XRE-family HTH domain